MKAIKLAIVFGVLSVALPVVAGDAARDLNTQGFRLYKQKKYVEAMDCFEKAIDVDPDYALPYYNLACVLSILRSQGKVCDYDAYKSRIIELLEDSVRLDPRRRKRIREDDDLDEIQDSFGYWKLVGLSPKKPDELKAILTSVSWYGPAPGAYGPMAGIAFEMNGKLSFWALEMPDDGSVVRAPWNGEWKLEGTKIRIRLDKPYDKKQEFVGTLDENGVLTIEGLNGPFRDDPDECSA